MTSAQTCAEVCRNPGVCGGTNGGTFWESGGTLGFVPHATSYPAAPALRMPAAAPMPPLAGPTHGNSTSSGTHATSAHYKQRTRAPQPRTWQHAWCAPCSSRPRGAAEHQPPRHPGVQRWQRLHFAPLTHQQPRRTSTPNPSGYDHFYRGHRGQTVTTPITYCHH